MKRFNANISLNVTLSAKDKKEAKWMFENLSTRIEELSKISHASHGAVLRAKIIKVEELKF